MFKDKPKMSKGATQMLKVNGQESDKPAILAGRGSINKSVIFYYGRNSEDVKAEPSN